MIISKSFEQIQLNKDTAVALGLFDGVHLGHQRVIAQALACAEEGLAPSVFTYSIHDQVPMVKKQFAQILDEEEKMQVLRQMGVQYVVQPPFEEFCNVGPKEFVENLLIGKMRAKVICCGKDFCFGKNAAGTVEDLKRYAQPLGAQVRIVEPVKLENGDIISSTGIRSCLKEGRMDLVREMLGRYYSVDFVVEHGGQLGRQLDFPTINQRYPSNYAIPRYGVYVSVTQLEDKLYPSVSNVGVKPTIGASSPLAETFIINYSGDLYGQRVRVWLCEFVRGEHRFGSIEQLQSQIATDTAAAKEKGPAYAKKLAEITGYQYIAGENSNF